MVVLGLGISGLISAVSVRRSAARDGKLVTAGLLMNGLSLAIPILVLMFGVGTQFTINDRPDRLDQSAQITSLITVKRISPKVGNVTI
jgi:hypothetical protein